MLIIVNEKNEKTNLSTIEQGGCNKTNVLPIEINRFNYTIYDHLTSYGETDEEIPCGWCGSTDKKIVHSKNHVECATKFYICKTCDFYTVYYLKVEEQTRSFPQYVDLSRINKQVWDDYSEAYECFNRGNFKAAASVCRSAIISIASSQGIVEKRGKKFMDYTKELEKRFPSIDELGHLMDLRKETSAIVHQKSDKKIDKGIIVNFLLILQDVMYRVYIDCDKRKRYE